jgi:uncharacterized repeat protein (TIGR03847 family)
MPDSFDFERPDHFTTGAVGAPGERVFYLQGREGGVLVTLKSEKEQVRALAQHLSGMLEKLPEGGRAARNAELLEPIEPVWAVASIGVGYDEAKDRIVIIVRQFVDEEEAEPATEVEPATARVAITRAQAAAFVERARGLMDASRKICPLCNSAIDASGHVCPRRNGHVAVFD